MDFRSQYSALVLAPQSGNVEVGMLRAEPSQSD